MCPVKNFEHYIAVTKSIRINLGQGFLIIPGANLDTEMSVEVFVAFYSATVHIYLFPFLPNSKR